jgi:hypothetical protein
MKLMKAAVAVLMFLIVLVVSYVIYIKYFRVDVVFYASMFVALLACVIVAPLVWFLPMFRSFSVLEKTQLIVINALLGYIFAISLPTVIDRSLSFYILEKLQQRNGGIQLSKFDYIFTNEYMREHQLVDIRITEQVESGTIRIEGDCVRLTDKGARLANFSRFFRQNFLPKQRLLRGEYTDRLIDPFARSDAAPDYLCK